MASLDELQLLQGSQVRVHDDLVGPCGDDERLLLHHLVVQDDADLLESRRRDHHLESVSTSEIQV